MKKRIDILEGSIGKNLFKLSLPVILTSLISILYNLTDIKFISTYLGDKEVSSAAAATFFIIFAMSFLMIAKNGAQILVAQSIGAKIYKHARAYARIAIILTTIFSILCLLISLIFTKELIMLVGVSEPDYLVSAIKFLRICSLGFPFLFMTFTLSAIISADGDTFAPFVFTSTGILVNVLLDYVFLGIFKFDISGAAIATVLSQVISAVLLCIYIRTPKSKFRKMKIFKIDNPYMYMRLIRIGLPSGISQALFTIISIVIAHKIAGIDIKALGVQRLGVQFEAFSWNIASGLSSAVATYVAQNYGAKKYDRVSEVYRLSMKSISIFGLMISIVFIAFARPLYSSFFEDEKFVNYGVYYLRIIGLTQIFQCIEIITGGAFNGIGKVKQPTIIGVIGTSLRIPFVYLLAPIFGINIIWWVISASMLLKGIVSYIWFTKSWNSFIIKENELKRGMV
ncbi:MATE family efflux transporter [Oceanivirga salmonicida]|uniref:MATE family efflux transporter n=4 Tax=Oceanivirga salmonicida TaxID=1769291 RepID=UPI0012E154AD|nr:MATE family efflux transporter [Oceanivirga salmonicida]